MPQPAQDSPDGSDATRAALAQLKVAQNALETIRAVIDKFGIETYTVIMRELSAAPVVPRHR